jgi:hypothetical protein
MAVFPLYFEKYYNATEALYLPYERTSSRAWDFTRFKPKFWQHLDHCVLQLMKLNIEADIILFHPYDHDHWGFDKRDQKENEHYLQYIIARLSAYRNIWWSLANEYDHRLFSQWTIADWDHVFQFIQANDPHDRFRSIHNLLEFYDYRKSWVTHCSIQRWDLDAVWKWRETYGKPVVVDEIGYEGNIKEGWGNLTAQEMVRRFWVGVCRGGYVTHGETYMHPEDILNWTKGGKLYGQSPQRIAFLKSIVEDAGQGLTPLKWMVWPGSLGRFEMIAGIGDDYQLIYMVGQTQSSSYEYKLPGSGKYQVDVIDTWDMKINTVGVFESKFNIKLPSKPYMAIRLQRVRK